MAKILDDSNPFARFGINGWKEAVTVTEKLDMVSRFEREDCDKALALPECDLPRLVRKSVELRLAYLKQRGLA